MEYYEWVSSNYILTKYQWPDLWIFSWVHSLTKCFSSSIFSLFQTKKKNRNKKYIDVCVRLVWLNRIFFQFNSFHLLNTILWPIDVKQTTLHCSMNLLFYFYSLKSVQAISVSYLCLLAKFSFKWTVFPVQNSNNLFNTC